VRVYVCACVSVYVRVCACVFVYVCVCVCVYPALVLRNSFVLEKGVVNKNA